MIIIIIINGLYSSNAESMTNVQGRRGAPSGSKVYIMHAWCPMHLTISELFSMDSYVYALIANSPLLPLALLFLLCLYLLSTSIAEAHPFAFAQQ